MDDCEILKTELMKLLDDIPLERLKALYIKALVASSAKVVNPDCRQGTERGLWSNCGSCHWGTFIRYAASFAAFMKARR